MDAYLAEEVGFGAILGPFKSHLVQEPHFSPFMTREKSGSDKRCVIIDLSWPKGVSVNDGVDKDSYLATDFSLTFPTVVHIIQKLKRIGKVCHIYKVYVSCAFRHVHLDRREYDLLGLNWGDVTYIVTCVPFGNHHGTQIFQRISDAVCHIVPQKGFKIINYVDGTIGVATLNVACHSFDTLCQLMQDLGLDISHKILVAPGTVAVCQGIEINTVTSTIAIPAPKLEQIRWSENGLSRNSAQSVNFKCC